MFVSVMTIAFKVIWRNRLFRESWSTKASKPAPQVVNNPKAGRSWACVSATASAARSGTLS